MIGQKLLFVYHPVEDNEVWKTFWVHGACALIQVKIKMFVLPILVYMANAEFGGCHFVH